MAIRLYGRKTLLKLGKWRFGIGYSTHGAFGIVVMAFYGLLNLMWYTLLAMFWMCYGAVWLMFVLPGRAIKKLINKAKAKKQINETDC